MHLAYLSSHVSSTEEEAMHRPLPVFRLVGPAGVVGATEHHVTITFIHGGIARLRHFWRTILTPEVRTGNGLKATSASVKLACAKSTEKHSTETPWTHERRTIFIRRLRAWYQESQLDIGTDLVACFCLIPMLNVVVLVVAMQSLGLAPRVDL